MNDREISQLLNSAVPQEPDSSSWAATVRAKAARRRTAVVIASLVTVVVVATPMLLRLTRTHEAEPIQAPTNGSSPVVSDSASPAPTPVAPSGATELTNPCQALAAALAENPNYQPGSDLSAGLPEGAQRIWMCGRSDMGFYSEVGPSEPLSQDVDQVVREINQRMSQPWVPDPNNSCTPSNQLSAQLFVEYSDGMRYLHLERNGCGVLSDGINQWSGGIELYQNLSSRFQAQRTASPAPTATATPSDPTALCSPAITLVPADEQQLVSAAVCIHDESTSVQPMPKELLNRFVAEWQAATETPTEFTETYSSRMMIVFHDAWGSAYRAYPQEDWSFLMVGPEGGKATTWYPSEELLVAFKDLTINQEWAVP